ncbi:MAG TPA: LamG-like jellyroll fold domain-containing protein [Kribbella sp.]
MAQAAGYSFNSDTVSGTTVRDLAGYFLNGTIVGSAAIVTSKTDYGNALHCTGGALQVKVAADTYPVDTSGGLSVGAWVKLDDTTAAARCIASGKDATALRWALYASNAAGNVEANIMGTTYASSTSIRDGNWHHVMLVVSRLFGPGAETVRVVVDGTIVLSSSSLTTNLGYPSGSIVIEAGRNATTQAQPLNGLLDDFRWWNDPVDDASFSTVRDNEQGDLQYAIYPFDDGTGDDFSIYNRDLTLAGSASFVAGLYGNALKSGAVAAGGVASVAFGDLDRLAITGWMRLDVAPVGSAVPIMTIRDSGGNIVFQAVVNTDRTVTCTWVTIYGTFSVSSTTTLTVDAWSRYHFNMNPTYVGIRIGTTAQVTFSTGHSTPHLTPTVLDLHTLYVGGDAATGGQVSFDYVTCTRNFINVPSEGYWTGPPIPTATRPANVARGIYEFNENTGAVADDKSTFNNDLTLTANGGWTPGVQGSALSNSGSAAAGARSTTIAWSATPAGWAFAGWFKCRASSSGARIIAMRAGAQEVAHVFYLSGAFQLRLYGSGGNTGILIPSTYPSDAHFPAETLTHLAGVCNGETVQFYINGVHIGSTTYSAGQLFAPTELNVGGDPSDGSNQEVADVVDSLQFFDTPISGSNVAWLYANPGALAIPPQNVTLNQAHETDTAYPLANSKTVTLATAHETDSGYGLSATKDAALATAHETDTGYAVTGDKTIGFATGSEADAASAVIGTKSATLPTAGEADTASPLVPSKTVTLATAHETDTAYTVTVVNEGAARVLLAAHETDTAYPVTASKTVTLATAHEVDRAIALILEGSGPQWPVLTVSNTESSHLEVSHGI